MFGLSEGETLGGHTLSPWEYVRLCKSYRVRIKSIFRAPMPPTYYGRLEGRESGETLAYLWFDAARVEWVMFSPENATEELTQAFS